MKAADLFLASTDTSNHYKTLLPLGVGEVRVEKNS